MIFSGKLSDIFKLGGRSRVPNSELFQFWNGLIREPKQGITQSRSKFGFTWREASFHDSQHTKKSSQAYAMKKIQIWKKVMNPFIAHWNEPFAGKEERVVNFCLHGLNSDRAGPICYSTLTSAARKDIMVQSGKANFCEDKSLIICFAGREKLFTERGI